MSTVEKVEKGVRVELEAEEAALMRALMEQLLELLGEGPAKDGDGLLASVGITEEATRPEDPVLARLFPDAYGDEEGGAAGEFRRYTEMGLRDGKREAAGTVLAGLAGPPTAAGGVETVISDADAQAWLRALNDVRLALGTRLDISEEWYEEAARLDPRDPRTAMFAAYDWLTMLQESLVRTLW
ncbi:DUF2017 domain-containing protein [Spirillospora sp. NPDC029432]|uniref:DUF2017 domain-containing protein n=1 Tax=Spirillospora sp. NPDC029432 TaxID=3154599 RepID=UPI003452076E